jgi:flavodoxin/Pyruvate/2-oxoacid:ferredoxin oxidoreductase delta subunit
MKTIIYYFTGTGNSLAIARHLANELEEQVELVPVVKFLHEAAIKVEADATGIIYPAWLHHIPPAIEEFIKKSSFNSTYIFAICSYSTSPYNSLFKLNALLEEKGKKLSAGFAIAMGGKYALLKDMVLSDETTKSRYLEEKLKVKEIARIVKDRQAVGIEGQYDEKDNEYGKLLINTHRDSYNVVEKFWLTEACDLCGLCEKICPRSNIKIANSAVLWDNNCDYCLACLHWCPKSAIQNGELTKKCGRHHHPEISIDDIISQK